jgi:chromosome segregation ATPase
MSNRVEELESRVAELQAAVDGLTEELVETRERLRALEESGDSGNETVTPADGEESTDADDAPATASADEATEEAEHAAEPPAETEADPADEASSDSSSDSDDIIVA